MCHATHSRHAVLIPVSRGYPPLKGRLSTRYSPVRHFPQTEACFSFDLHVLSTPPAFVLSQDQTLHCKYGKIPFARFMFRNSTSIRCRFQGRIHPKMDAVT